ncbi:hypothetical protein DFH11DRAFT_1748345 [Phellopilus nigrolimitatus]|nr:hypothetical protein DFH11DRAFT_1748345 [Phellopilus nigrolimitatus]
MCDLQASTRKARPDSSFSRAAAQLRLPDALHSEQAGEELRGRRVAARVHETDKKRTYRRKYILTKEKKKFVMLTRKTMHPPILKTIVHAKTGDGAALHAHTPLRTAVNSIHEPLRRAIQESSAEDVVEQAALAVENGNLERLDLFHEPVLVAIETVSAASMSKVIARVRSSRGPPRGRHGARSSAFQSESGAMPAAMYAGLQLSHSSQPWSTGTARPNVVTWCSDKRAGGSNKPDEPDVERTYRMHRGDIRKPARAELLGEPLYLLLSAGKEIEFYRRVNSNVVSIGDYLVQPLRNSEPLGDDVAFSKSPKELAEATGRGPVSFFSNAFYTFLYFKISVATDVQSLFTKLAVLTMSTKNTNSMRMNRPLERSALAVACDARGYERGDEKIYDAETDEEDEEGEVNITDDPASAVKGSPDAALTGQGMKRKAEPDEPDESAYGEPSRAFNVHLRVTFSGYPGVYTSPGPYNRPELQSLPSSPAQTFLDRKLTFVNVRLINQGRTRSERRRLLEESAVQERESHDLGVKKGHDLTESANDGKEALEVVYEPALEGVKGVG